MLEHNMAAARAFAFATVLSHDPVGAEGKVTFTPGQPTDEPCPTLENFALALAGRLPLTWHGAGGVWNLQWS
jgi:hypothetical protein